MNSKIARRVMEEARHILETKDTVRAISNIFKVSKSTVHKDLHERLLELDQAQYQQVNKILKYHMDVRHIRGGESTRKKYQNLDTN